MKHYKCSIFCILIIFFLLIEAQAIAADSSYDPLSRSVGFTPETLDLSIHDAERKRDIPIRVYLPSKKSPVPVVLFSHGLGGSREGSAYLGNHWAGRGYVAVFLQHPGSDISVWKDKPAEKRMAAMRKAASKQNFMLRVKDVPAVLDQLQQWNRDDGHVLSGLMNLHSVGMSGHSFGAVTTQALSGQRAARGRNMLPDTRIDAAVVMSPSSPHLSSPQAAFGKVALPWLLMTGTKDTAPIGRADITSRLAVFPALPPGDKYELVLHGAKHSAFTDSILPGKTEPRNPNHHRIILALSTAFWDTYLRNEAAAREWLRGVGPESVLEENDQWQSK